jgi:hypothetical protein
MYLDFLQLCFGLLILCSLEYSFREAAKERGKERRGSERASFQVKSLAKKSAVTIIEKLPLEGKIRPQRKKRVRVSSLPIYRSKEIDDALREVRTV